MEISLPPYKAFVDGIVDGSITVLRIPKGTVKNGDTVLVKASGVHPEAVKIRVKNIEYPLLYGITVEEAKREGYTVPDFCLPGGFEYQDALDKEVHACMTGEKKPQDALDDASRAFERITRRVGKDKARQSWFALTENLAAPIKKATGRDAWKL